MAPLLLIAALCIVAGGSQWRRSSSSLRSASSPACNGRWAWCGHVGWRRTGFRSQCNGRWAWCGHVGWRRTGFRSQCNGRWAWCGHVGPTHHHPTADHRPHQPHRLHPPPNHHPTHHHPTADHRPHQPHRLHPPPNHHPTHHLVICPTGRQRLGSNPAPGFGFARHLPDGSPTARLKPCTWVRICSSSARRVANGSAWRPAAPGSGVIAWLLLGPFCGPHCRQARGLRSPRG